MVKININKELEEELLSLVKNREKKIPWNKSKELDKFIDSSLSENTAHGYTYDWKEFVTWCEVNKKPSLPASYDTIGEYLKHLSKISSPQTKQPYKQSTIKRKLYAIVKHQRKNGYGVDTQIPYITDVLKTIATDKGVKQNSSDPLSKVEIRTIIDSINIDKKSKINSQIRDKALILLGFITGMRRSELVDLNRFDVETRIEGIVINIKKSKTDQKGYGREIAITPSSSNKYCPVFHINELIEMMDGKEKNLQQNYPLFVSIDKSGDIKKKSRLSDKSVALILQKRAKTAGIFNKNIAGHSLRRGMISAAHKEKASYKQIMNSSGHRSADMVNRYIADEDLFKDTISEKLDI